MGQGIYHKALALSTQQTTSPQSVINETTTINIQGGNGNDKYDVNGKEILQAKNNHGYNIIQLDEGSNKRTAELPVGTLIFLHFPTGEHHVSVSPDHVVLDWPHGEVHLPAGDIGLLKVVGTGPATITVITTKKVYPTLNLTQSTASSTANWSGYVHQTGGPYTDIVSYWTVPTASSCSGGDKYSSAWIGLDGVNNNDLIQIGTESDCLSGSPFYQAWWEILPTYQTEQAITGYTVHAGDNMFAEIKQTSGSNWNLTIKDFTQNWASTSAQIYGGAGNSTEWIIERPTINNAFATLTNYGSTSFFDNQQNGANPNHSYLNDSWAMTSDGTPNGTILSNVSQPRSDTTDAFTAAYGSSVPSSPTAAWSIQASPNPDTDNYLYSVTSNSSSDVWAVGYGHGTTYHPVAIHWDGSTWGSNTISGNAGYELIGVSAISSTSLLAVGAATGSSPTGTIAFYGNGSTWSLLPSESPGTIPGLLSVGSDSSGDAWAVGQVYDTNGKAHSLIEKYNGSQTGFKNWLLTGADATHLIPNETGTHNNMLLGVTVSSSTDAWAVGVYSDSNNYFQPLTYHWDGTSWTKVSTPLPSGGNGGKLYSVTELSSSNVWAVGYYTNSSNYTLTYILHWDGTSWNVVSSPSPSPSHDDELKAVSAISSQEIYAVGITRGPTTSQYNKPLVLKYDGTQWLQATVPAAGNPANNNLFGVTVPTSGQAWAVGNLVNGSPTYRLIDWLR